MRWGTRNLIGNSVCFLVHPPFGWETCWKESKEDDGGFSTCMSLMCGRGAWFVLQRISLRPSKVIYNCARRWTQPSKRSTTCKQGSVKSSSAIQVSPSLFSNRHKNTPVLTRRSTVYSGGCVLTGDGKNSGGEILTCCKLNQSFLLYQIDVASGNVTVVVLF